MLFYEGLLGMISILCPRGIDFKDGLLFVSLPAKTQSKEIGILRCDGGATRKSPRNALRKTFTLLSNFFPFS